MVTNSSHRQRDSNSARDVRFRRSGAMSESSPSPRRKVWKYLLSILLGGVLLLLIVACYMTTDSFQVWVRHRLVTEVERISFFKVYRAPSDPLSFPPQASSV